MTSSVADAPEGAGVTTGPAPDASAGLPSLREAEEAGRVLPYLDSFIQSLRTAPYSELLLSINPPLIIYTISYSCIKFF